MCAVSSVPENVSRTSVVFGVASLVILLTGFVTGSWVTTREPYRVPNTDVHTAAAFRIGLWKVCPTLRKINSTLNFRSISCKYIRYTSDWDLDLVKEDFGIGSDVYFTQSFVTKMRWCTPLVGTSLCLMLAGCVFSFSGHFYKDQKTLIASSLHTLAGLVLAAGLFVFASVLNDSFSPVVYQSAVDDDARDAGFDGELRSDYDYRYGWSFVACSLAFLASEASAVFTITAYFRRLEDRVRYTAVDRKPSSPDTPSSPSSSPSPPRQSGGGDRSSVCSAAVSPSTRCGDAAGGCGVVSYPNLTSSSSPPQPPQPPPPTSCAAAADANGACSSSSSSRTPPDICPPKIGSDAAVASAAVPASCKTAYRSAAPSQLHYRQTLAVGGKALPCYEVDTAKPCTCATTTRRYATIAAAVARRDGGKLQYTATATPAAANKRCAAAGLASVKEPSDARQRGPPDPPGRRLKGGYVVPQTPIAALEALDCPPAVDPRLVLPCSSV